MTEGKKKKGRRFLLRFLIFSLCLVSADFILAVYLQEGGMDTFGQLGDISWLGHGFMALAGFILVFAIIRSIARSVRKSRNTRKEREEAFLKEE